MKGFTIERALVHLVCVSQDFWDDDTCKVIADQDGNKLVQVCNFTHLFYLSYFGSMANSTLNKTFLGMC